MLRKVWLLEGWILQDRCIGYGKILIITSIRFTFNCECIALQGTHVVCAKMTDKFLEFTKSKGNDLITPSPGNDVSRGFEF